MSDDKNQNNDDDKSKQSTGDDIRAELDALSRKVKRYEEDIAYKDREIERLKEQKDTRDKHLDKTVTDSELFKAREKELRDEFGQKEERYKSDLAKTQLELKAEKVTKDAMIEAAKYFNQDSLELIQSIVERHCDLEDGQFVVRNDKGEIRYSESNSRVPMSRAEFMHELVRKYPSCAKPQGRQGSGNDEGSKYEGRKTTGKSYRPEDLAGLGVNEQAKIIKDGDVESAKQLLREVTKAYLQ